MMSQRKMRTNNPTKAVKQTKKSLPATLTTSLKNVIPLRRSASQRLVKMPRLVIPKPYKLTRRHIITITTKRKKKLHLSHTNTKSVMICATCFFKRSRLIGA